MTDSYSIIYSTHDKPSYFFQWEADRFETQSEAQRFISKHAEFFAPKRTIRLALEVNLRPHLAASEATP